MYAIRLASMDGLLIGPFHTYEAAEDWWRRSIFTPHTPKILLLTPPRKDHQR